MSHPLSNNLLTIIGLCLISLLTCDLMAQSVEPEYTLVENQGQWHENVQYRSAFPGGYFYLENGGFTYKLYDLSAVTGHHPRPFMGDLAAAKLRYHAVKARFLRTGKAIGNTPQQEPLDEYFNYYLGDDPQRWASHVRAYHSVRQDGLYPGIYLFLNAEHHQLKYDLVVTPTGDPDDIAIAFEGADRLFLRQGNLVIETSLGEIVEQAPYAYQTNANGQLEEVACHFELRKNQVRFVLPEGYDRTRDLVIDPTLIFSSYSGSRADNFGYTAAFDNDGFLYSGSSAFGQSGNYPTNTGAFQETWAGGSGLNGGTDIAITKYDTTGTFRVYSTLLGGNRDEVPQSLIANDAGELYVYGTTGSGNYPVTANAYDDSFNGGPNVNLSQVGLGVVFPQGADMVLSRFSPDGRNLLASTFLGGTGTDGLNQATDLAYNYADEFRGEVEIDQQGQVYVVSSTRSTDLPIVGNSPIQNQLRGNQDGCIFKLDPSLSTLRWSTYLGGNLTDAIYSIAIDSDNNLYVAGGTNSTSNFPTTANTLSQTNNGGRADGFVSRISANGDNLLASTYYGSDAYDQAYFVELDKRNNVHLLGQTHASGSFYIQNANYGTPNSGQYISKLTPQLNAITWSTAFGTGTGAPNISPTAFLVDVCNSIYLSGWGGNTNQLPQIPGRNIAGYTIGMDVTPDAFQSTTDSSDFYLMVIDGDANGLIFGSFFGGHVSSEHVDGGTSRFDRQGRIYQSVCAGCRECQTCPSRSDFPIFPANAVSDTNLSTNCNNAVFKLDFDLPLIIADFNGPDIGCAPFTASFTNSSIVLGTTTVLWNFGDGNTSTDLQPSHTYTDTGTFEVSLIISDLNSCNRNDTLIRTIRVRGPQSLNLGTISLCEVRPVGIGIPPLGDPDANYTWTPTTGLSNPNISNPSADGSTDIDYQLLIERDGNCVDTVRQRIIYSPLDPFVVTATSDRDSLSTGQQTTLHVEPDSGFIIQWTPANLLDNPTSSDPQYLGTIDPEEQEEITFTVTVSDPRDSSCFKTSSVSLLIFEEVCGDPEVFLPNAFTPNGDGSNDVLFVRGDNIEQVSLVIYNRWGQQVFETKDAAIGWDGRFNGTDVDPDVYVFYLEVTCLDGQEFIKEGNITVIR